MYVSNIFNFLAIKSVIFSVFFKNLINFRLFRISKRSFYLRSPERIKAFRGLLLRSAIQEAMVS